MAANKRRAALLLGGFASAVLVVVLALALLLGAGPGAGSLAAAAVSVLAAATAYLTCEEVVVRATHAQAADPARHARLHNLVEWLCFSSGLPKPRVHVVEDEALNALAAGRGPRRSSLVVTSGLLDGVSRVELEAVLAHELSHVKSGDALVSTLAAVLVALPATVLRAPTAARLVDAAVGGPKEAVADLAGVSLTRYPPGLVAALEKLRDGPTAVRCGARVTAHMWIQNPLDVVPAPGTVGDPSHVSSSSLVEERIEALRDL